VSKTASRVRGRTSTGRLRALDQYLVLHHSELLMRTDGLFADAAVYDVGVGEYPWTTLELSAAVRTVAPALTVVGFEADSGRLLQARRHETSSVRFESGSFEQPLPLHPPARVVRAMNLLRGQREEDVPRLWRYLAAPLVPDGIVLEGSTDPLGNILCAFVLRKSVAGVTPEGLLFHTDFKRGFAPMMFRDVLPRLWRRRVRAGEPIHALFEQWTACWESVRAQSPVEAFRRSAEMLSRGGFGARGVNGMDGALYWPCGSEPG